jgi:hypothetical protein
MACPTTAPSKKSWSVGIEAGRRIGGLPQRRLAEPVCGAGGPCLNPDLYIVARANRPENESKLKHAGANRVAMPYQIGGYHMASMALRPNVVDYMDVMTGKNGLTELEVEEMVVGEHSRLAGRRLGKTLV